MSKLYNMLSYMSKQAIQHAILHVQAIQHAILHVQAIQHANMHVQAIQHAIQACPSYITCYPGMFNPDNMISRHVKAI